MLDGRSLVALLDHEVGCTEGLFRIAEAQLLVVELLVILEVIMRIGFVDDGRAGLERLLDVEDSRQGFVVDPHQLARSHRRGLALGDDRHDGLALVAHFVDRKRGLVILAEIDQTEQRILVHRHIRCPQDALHARCALRRADIDGADAGMVMRAAHNLQVEQSLEGVIIEEARTPRDMAWHILALNALADDVEIVIALIGEEVLADIEHRVLPQARCWPRAPAAARMALMIGS